jgi:hypothetical protein
MLAAQGSETPRVARGGESSRASRRLDFDHVTIITNDFSIPWYWLKNTEHSPFLCEACSLGILQLTTSGIPPSHERVAQANSQMSRLYRALLVNGSTRLPFANDELDSISRELTEETRRETRSFRFEVERAVSADDLVRIKRQYRDRARRVREFKVLHFTGHYSADALMMDEVQIEEDDLKDFIHDSLLVLDGCSSSQGLDAWTDIKGVTQRLLDLGALACIGTVLPVKHDPIVGDVFWGAFYKSIRTGTLSVGQSLVEARKALKAHFKQIDSRNPAWVLYQLVGNPSVRLFEGADANA